MSSFIIIIIRLDCGDKYLLGQGWQECGNCAIGSCTLHLNHQQSTQTLFPSESVQSLKILPNTLHLKLIPVDQSLYIGIDLLLLY